MATRSSSIGEILGYDTQLLRYDQDTHGTDDRNFQTASELTCPMLIDEHLNAVDFQGEAQRLGFPGIERRGCDSRV